MENAIKKPRGRPHKEVKNFSRITAVRMPKALDKSLKAYCESNDITPSNAVRGAVKELLKNQFDDPKAEKKE